MKTAQISYKFGEVKHLSTHRLKIKREFVSSGERKRIKCTFLTNAGKNNIWKIFMSVEGDSPVLSIILEIDEYGGVCEALPEYSKPTC